MTIQERAIAFCKTIHPGQHREDWYQIIKLLVEEVQRLNAEKAERQYETLEDKS
jgi:hypothetical protein